MTQIKQYMGSLFKAKCQTLVNPVNCVGVMGAGTALAFKYKYPEMFDKYAELCKEEKLKLGNLWLYDVPNGNKKVLNVAIKEHWKHHVTYDTINEILLNFVFMYQVLGIKSVAFPILGQGNLNKQ